MQSSRSRRRAAGFAALVVAVTGGALTVVSWSNGAPTASAAELPARGASMPYTMYEAEDGTTGGGAAVVGPNRTVGDVAGEASGRRAVTLTGPGAYVEWTTKAPTNTLVTRFSIPDGTDSSLNVYVNDTLNTTISLTSRYAWLYGDEAAPTNSPGVAPRHIYDEANTFLNGTVPAGSRIRLQNDAGDSGTFAIDFVNTEQVAPVANPDPARYAVPNGFSQAAVQQALDRARSDGNVQGVYLPPGDYQTSGKFQVYGKAVRIIGAGPWYARFRAPSEQQNTDVGFRVESSAGGSTFANFAYFGNYTTRIDGPGKVFDLQNVADLVIDNVWAEHQVCLFWGQNTDRVTIKNSRIRNTFADGVNMTNGSTDNLISNNDARATGDDSFALFSAVDAGGADETGNVFENLSATLTWRAASIAVYGGYGNTFRNIYIADTLVYSGITISSLDFGIAMNGFGASPPTVLDNISIVRAGGRFWGDQTFPAIWAFSASKAFQGIRVSNVDIVDPTYSGVMFQTNYVDGRPQNPVRDTVFTNVSITGARKSGDAHDAKSGYGIWVQNTAVGEATFTGVRFSGNAKDIENTSPSFVLRTTVGAPPTAAPTTRPPTAPATSPATRPTAAPTSVPPSTTDLAAGRPVTVSGHNDVYTGARAVDGDRNSYWEGRMNTFPASLTVDLGSARRVGRLTFALPAAWDARQQEIVVSGSTDGSAYQQLVAGRSYTFTPSASVTVPAPRDVRFVRVEIRANTGWPTAQLSYLGIFGS